MEGDARQFFRSAVVEYDEVHYGARSLMSVRLACMTDCLDRITLAPGSLTLDAGCGPGHLLQAIKELGGRGIGVDTSPGMLGLSAQRLAMTPPPLSVANVESLPFADGTFDAVCTAGVFEYLSEDRAGLLELFRVMRPGGVLIFPITNFWSPVGYLDFAVEALKRRTSILEAFNAVWTRDGRSPIRARQFTVRRQRPGATRSLLRGLGFELIEERYFHFLPFPHPIDRLLPVLSVYLGAKMERLAGTRLACLAEGWLAVCRKPGNQGT